jgi:carboxyl-terminal processing protease
LYFNGVQCNPQNESIYEDLEPFFEVISIIRSEYIDKDINITDLVQGAIKGTLEELDDPYSRYLDPVTFQREQEDMFMGFFEGLGIIVTIKDDQLTVISPIEDTPAYRAGIKAGDYIMEIDGESTEGIALDEAVNILRGEKGEKVVLGIKRENVDEMITIEVIRDTITVEAVKAKLIEDDRIGYIRISTFNVNTGPELKDELDLFEDQNLEGIIVDLRNNPGGLLDSAIEVASQFIKEGSIVNIKGRDGKINTFYSYGNKYPEWPVVILVNKGSASASEIVAGAIQDAGRGMVVGETTFGKGLVQQVYSLSNDGGITITTSEYSTPSGKSINTIGIKPDVLIEITETEETEEDIQLNKAVEILLEK